MNKPLQYWIVIFPNNPTLRLGVKSVDVTETEAVIAVYFYSQTEAENMAWIAFGQMNAQPSIKTISIEREEPMNNQQSPDTERKMKIFLLEAALQAMLTTYEDRCRTYTNQGIRYVDEYALWLTTSRDLVNELQAQLSALKNPVDAEPAPVSEPGIVTLTAIRHHRPSMTKDETI